jgi:gentisate 1,2-dioxygenase
MQTTASHTIPSADFAAVRDLEQLYSLLRETGMGPGWNKPEPAIWPAPKKNFVPAHWRYALAKPALAAAGGLVSTELAERRNLILANPVPGNNYATARTIIAAYQMVMPGETARTHRHTPNALRVVVDSDPEMYTIVSGRKIPMLPGDVLLTPNWLWHGHSNESASCAYWIDFLDAPLVQLLEPMFFEAHPDTIERTEIVDERSPMRFAFADMRGRVRDEPESAPGQRELRLGPTELSTLSLTLVALDKGCNAAAKRTTANCTFAVVEGSGRSVIDEHVFEWERGDVFVVPAWRRHEYRANEPSCLVRVSDEPVMRALALLREEA